MPITTDLTTTIGQIRLLIGDTEASNGVKPGGGNFTDAEITYFYDREKSLSRAAALACETLAYLWNTHPDFEADGLRVDRGKVAQGWWRAALRFRAYKGAKVIPVLREEPGETG